MADPSVPPNDPEWVTYLRDQPDVQVPPSPEIERRDIPPSVPPSPNPRRVVTAALKAYMEVGERTGSPDLPREMAYDALKALFDAGFTVARLEEVGTAATHIVGPDPESEIEAMREGGYSWVELFGAGDEPWRDPHDERMETESVFRIVEDSDG